MKKAPKLMLLHVAAECYPAAKEGGLGDVVGTLPKYQQRMGIDAHVVIPKYGTKWFDEHEFETCHWGEYWNPSETIRYAVNKLTNSDLNYHLYVVDIPGKFDRNGVYSDEFGYFGDETERWISFQRCVLDWLMHWEIKPSVVHCHDHHAGLVPFMMKFCPIYNSLEKIPTIFTIHNERYQGAFSWYKQYLLPHFDPWKSGMLDWNERINPFAAAVKCADRVTTVSPSYMEELKYNSPGLEWLFHHEQTKLRGILNGIDNEIWNPKKDPLLEYTLKRSNKKYKESNKKWLCDYCDLDSSFPLVGFIGRMVYQKGGDELIKAIYSILGAGAEMTFCILGTGDKAQEYDFYHLNQIFPDKVKSFLKYDEALAHKIYAGSDFLIMPSRTEPCGLNQMYAMRYGTIPVVHDTGGLRDSVVDYRLGNGTGIKFHNVDSYTIAEALGTASYVFSEKTILFDLVDRGMKQDFSWEKSAQTYLDVYEELI